MSPGVPGKMAANFSRQESLDTGCESVGGAGVAPFGGAVKLVVLNDVNTSADCSKLVNNYTCQRHLWVESNKKERWVMEEDGVDSVSLEMNH